MDVIVAGGGPAGLMTAALLDVAGVRVDVYERGSEPTPQFRGTALHPRTLEVLTMFDAGDGRRISDVLLAQGRRTHAGDSQLAAGRARRQKAPYSRPGPSATLTGISRTGFRRARPILAGPDQQHRAVGRRQPAWNCLPCAPSARTPMRRGASRPHPAAN
jgi:2-polyprenyl-6-methoxyphenol hydroxylase-like FAD-dependent oxidoreductase